MSRSSISVSLALLLATLMAVAAWLGVRALGQANRQDAALRVVTETVRQIERDDFARAEDAIDGLAQHPSIVAHASSSRAASATVDAVLLQARLTAAAAIVMILDADGKVISCSSTGESLVGYNYAFRPYFSDAMRGKHVVYGAIGITTRLRGFYFSAPIGPKAAPIGVAVAKVELDEIDRSLARLGSPVMLVSPDHVVFATNRAEWLMRAARPLDAEQRQRLRQTRQFADNPIDALPFDTRQGLFEFRAVQYSAVEVPFVVATGFKAILLDPVRDYPLTPSQRQFVVGTGLSGVLLTGLVLALLLANARRARAEMQLRRTELHLEVTLDSLSDAVITTDASGNVARMNPAALALTGCVEENAVGRPLREVLKLALPDIQQLAPTEPESAACLAVESRVSLVHGEERHIVHRTTRLRGGSDESAGTVFVARDVTEENRLREQLQQAQKMEAIGRLAGGIAHDFNNLLSVILGNAELLNRKLEQPAMQSSSREIVAAATHAGELTRKLLAFSRKASLKSTTIDVHVVLDEAIALFSYGLVSRFRLVQSREAQATHVLGDATQLKGAFLNLLINARDAMQGGGAIFVTTRNVAISANSNASDGTQAGLEILFEDEGEGIPEALRGRIFEPFFTTKTEGRGTGLGLSTVYGCMQSHRGCIDVESREGNGTRFRLRLPTTLRPQVAEVDRASRQSNPGGIVLLIDADPALRDLAERALTELAHGVESVQSTALAMRLLKRAEASFTLVVLDTGNDDILTAAGNVAMIRNVRATVPILLTSATMTEFDSIGPGDALVRVLTRPYRVEDLGRAIDELVGVRNQATRSRTTPKD